jgi:tRNA pseudouridine13 synthase
MVNGGGLGWVADLCVPDPLDKKWDTSSSQQVKQLTEEDLPNYTIFDIVLPLPGHDVEYPGGSMEELYAKILKADGLDMHRMRREQR